MLNWKLNVTLSFEFSASFITFNGDPVLNLLDTVTFMRYFSSLSGGKIGSWFCRDCTEENHKNIRKVSE